MTRSSEAAESELRRRLGPGLKTHVPLKDTTALALGGVADYFFAAATPESLITAVRTARRLGLPVATIGSGSHSVVSDYGFPGLIVMNRAANLTTVADRSQVVAESGCRLRDVVLAAAGRSLAGLGPLLTLGGTLGGLLAVGAGTAEMNLGSVIRRVTILRPDGSVAQIGLSDFQADRSREVVIVAVVLQAITARPDQVTAEIAAPEQMYRRWQTPSVRWLGPILSVPTARRPFQIGEILTELPSRELVVGQASFSFDRPNYIEIRGRTTAREIRQLVTMIYTAAVAVTDQPLAVHCTFLGRWDDIL